MSKDITERLRDGHQYSGMVDPLGVEAAEEIERLRFALMRIDGINDNPADYNSEINEVLRGALDPVAQRDQTRKDQEGLERDEHKRAR